MWGHLTEQCNNGYPHSSGNIAFFILHSLVDLMSAIGKLKKGSSVFYMHVAQRSAVILMSQLLKTFLLLNRVDCKSKQQVNRDVFECLLLSTIIIYKNIFISSALTEL